MSATFKTILKAASLFGSIQVVNILINLVRTKFVAVLIGPAGVGLNSIYNGTRSLLCSATNFGLDISGVRDISQKYESPDGCASAFHSICVLRSWTVVLALFGTVLTFLIAGPLSLFSFQDTEHTISYMILSPIIGISTLACGEVAILKGMHRLKSVALVSVMTTLISTAVLFPIYYLLRIKGVIPGLISVYVINLLVTICFSYRLVPPRFDFSRATLGSGVPMLKVGVSIMSVNMIGRFVELLTRSALNGMGSLDIVGLYSANATIINTFAGIFVASVGSDFYPRLSGVFSDSCERQLTVRGQCEFLMLVSPPAIVISIFALPVIVPMLLSEKFVEIIPLAQISMTAVIFKMAHIPYSHSSLAAGDSKNYFTLGIVQTAGMLLVIPGYYYGGLMGTGIALILTNIIDFGISLVIAGCKYGITMSRRLVSLFAIHLSLIVAAYFCAQTLQRTSFVLTAFAIFIASSLSSFFFYRHH